MPKTNGVPVAFLGAPNTGPLAAAAGPLDDGAAAGLPGAFEPLELHAAAARASAAIAAMPSGLWYFMVASFFGAVPAMRQAALSPR
jgi:hypothetical protein